MPPLARSSHILAARAGPASTFGRPSAAGGTTACIADGLRGDLAMPLARGGVGEHRDGWQGNRRKMLLGRAPFLPWLSGRRPASLRTVVEAGDEQAPVVFDRPVRILLAGQAVGRTFCVNGGAAPAGADAVEPIDRACAANDAQRVHVQLGGAGELLISAFPNPACAAEAHVQIGGAGECHLDAAGGDKIVFAYPLTRFDTALSGRGAPSPDDANARCASPRPT